MYGGIAIKTHRNGSKKINYKELWSLRKENQRLTETNQILNDELINIFDKLTDPETREKIFSLSDALIGGKSVLTFGGGGGSDSDFGWDGRRPVEEELTNRVSAFRETSDSFC